MEIWTLGHSTRSLEELVAVLRAHRILRLVDVRHFPRSRHNPQFNREVLEQRLPEEGVEYAWLEELGGFREGGYRAHVTTPDFRRGIERLKELAVGKSTAILCAELLWFKCHRRYIADELSGQGWRVWHIFDETRVEQHEAGRQQKIRCD